jgi:hypothetical protein
MTSKNQSQKSRQSLSNTETKLLNLEAKELDKTLNSLVSEISRMKQASVPLPKQAKNLSSSLSKRAVKAANGLAAESVQGLLSGVGVTIESEPLVEALEIGEELLVKGIKELYKLF